MDKQDRFDYLQVLARLAQQQAEANLCYFCGRGFRDSIEHNEGCPLAPLYNTPVEDEQEGAV